MVLNSRVRLNGNIEKRSSQKIAKGDVVEYEAEAEQIIELKPEEGTEIEILYRDEDLTVINKPAGLLTHPNPGHGDASVLNRLLARGIETRGGEDPLRPGVVHRLDRDTSGVLILTNHEDAHRAMSAAFRERKVQKTYHAITVGKVRRMEFACEMPLARDPKRRNTRCVDPEGKSATTRFKLVRLLREPFALFEAHPREGRTHQIRVHLAKSALPILGDPLYSDGHASSLAKQFGVSRTMLHCHQLEFHHPFCGKELCLIAEKPDDWEECLKKLG